MLMDKTIVICDSCGEKVVIDYVGSKNIFGRSALGDNLLPDWSEIKGRHLCPSCTPAYEELKKRHEEEERKLLGVKTFELEL